LGEWSDQHGSVASKQKTFIGKILHFYPEAKVAHVRIKTRELRLHDPILIIGDTTGVVETTVQSLWVNDQPSEHAGKGIECTIKVPAKVRPGDNLYLWEERD
jgi:U32 family peptidase